MHFFRYLSIFMWRKREYSSLFNDSRTNMWTLEEIKISTLINSFQTPSRQIYLIQLRTIFFVSHRSTMTMKSFKICCVFDIFLTKIFFIFLRQLVGLDACNKRTKERRISAFCMSPQNGLLFYWPQTYVSRSDPSIRNIFSSFFFI
jgi:hypothetical protein